MAHTVLVTGATGMIGQALVPLLARRNDVRAIFALTHTSEYMGSSCKVTPVRGDVTGSGFGDNTRIQSGNSRSYQRDRTRRCQHAVFGFAR